MRKGCITLVLLLVLASPVLAKVGGGDIFFPAKKVGDAMFSHEAHVADAGLNCTDCHDRPYVTHAKHKTVRMVQMQKGASCGSCHDGKIAFSVTGNCVRCHKKIER